MSYCRQQMKYFLLIIILCSLLTACDRVPSEIKSVCAVDHFVINAKTNKAAEIAYEACIARMGY